MPINNNIIILVQQEEDGAKAHLPVDDPVFKAKVEQLYHGNKNTVTLYTQLEYRAG
jgi:hypothetical protein